MKGAQTFARLSRSFADPQKTLKVHWKKKNILNDKTE